MPCTFRIPHGFYRVIDNCKIRAASSNSTPYPRGEVLSAGVCSPVVGGSIIGLKIKADSVAVFANQRMDSTAEVSYKCRGV